ncbi:MAG: CehA/McbA family metallohydrolase [Anaerolineales bacterium]|nr:CehA/McbA family metallohydrolase [Anaerolineales bacterium]
MIELAGNLHLHTPYSDGELYHADLAAAAARAGLDFLITTDHNVYVEGVDRWTDFPGGRRVLMLAGEEIHHQDRTPQKNHLLVVGARTELSRFAPDPQALIDAVNRSGGAAFLAHPYDPAAPLVNEQALGWVDLDVQGFAGLEIWNYMSEFKSLFRNRLEVLFYALFPSLGILGPCGQTLALWDRLLAQGRRISAVGGPDAHGHAYSMGPLRKVVFPYEYLFRAVVMHVLVDSVSGDADKDGRAITEALRTGRGWVAYDLSKPSRGFSFRARGEDGEAIAGGDIPFSPGLILRADLPHPARWRMILAGEGIVAQGSGTQAAYCPSQPGAYRLEARRAFRGRLRGWIFSNPIYLR